MDYKKLFETYNKIIEEATEDFFEKVDTESLRYSDEDYRNFLLDRTAIWGMISIDGMGKPAEIIDSISTKEELIDSFKVGAMICSDELPEIYIQKIREFSGEIDDLFLELSLDNKLLLDKEKFLISNEAIKMTGLLGRKESGNELIRLLYFKGIPELIYETTKDAIVNIGAILLDDIIKKIDESDTVGSEEEYLLMAAAEIGRTSENDKIYRCLVRAFKAMPNKIHGAMCLFDYGDGRAITVLRTYLANQGKEIDVKEFNLIAGIIKDFGGSIDDLQ